MNNDHLQTDKTMQWYCSLSYFVSSSVPLRPVGITTTVNESIFTYREGESWQEFYDEGLTFVPTYDPVFVSPDAEEAALSLCRGDQMCLFDVAVTGRTDIGLSTLAASEEVEQVVNVSLPG